MFQSELSYNRCESVLSSAHIYSGFCDAPLFTATITTTIQEVSSPSSRQSNPCRPRLKYCRKEESKTTMLRTTIPTRNNPRSCCKPRPVLRTKTDHLPLSHGLRGRRQRSRAKTLNIKTNRSVAKLNTLSRLTLHHYCDRTSAQVLLSLGLLRELSPALTAVTNCEEPYAKMPIFMLIWNRA